MMARLAECGWRVRNLITTLRKSSRFGLGKRIRDVNT